MDTVTYSLEVNQPPVTDSPCQGQLRQMESYLEVHDDCGDVREFTSHFPHRLYQRFPVLSLFHLAFEMHCGSVSSTSFTEHTNISQMVLTERGCSPFVFSFDVE
jgi:hypothetical protein